MKYTRTYVTDILYRRIAEVTFTKKNKKNKIVRVMRCTLNLDFVPVNKHPKKAHKLGDIIAVYDVEKNDWRSFDINDVSNVV